VAFSVRVEGIRFSAAHFATYGGECEPMHGHSYEVAAEVEGGLGEDSWVIDFSELKDVMRGLCAELDHHFILQTESRELQVDHSPAAWKVRTAAGLGYVLPVSDVAALPIDNSTAERLAEYLSGQVWQALVGRGHENIERVSVEVWEGPGQRARYSRERLLLD
jgi:6-pyruvoyltetrahydropterin/6-carboxytetrahydropterin synthase